MSVDRYDLVYRGEEREMIRRWPSDERSPGEWVRYESHVAEVCALRDKLLEVCKECSSCGGTGMVTVTLREPPGSGEFVSRVEECGDCEDIREVLGQ